MMYPFMTLNDKTEIVHSEMRPDGSVKVYMETPDETLCFKHATCYLPSYQWEDVLGYTPQEIAFFEELLRHNAHLFFKFARSGGIQCT